MCTLLQQVGCVLPDQHTSTESDYLQAVLDALCELSSTDPLTGLLNRRAFHLVLERELDRVARSGEQALLLAVDIDHFKSFNDRYGHLAGDMVIRSVAQALQQSVRPMDAVARMGGEEFCVVCPNCLPTYAPVMAERIRVTVEEKRISVSDHLPPLSVTVSCGGAFATPWIRGHSLEWLERADAQLYKAKHLGRNRIHLESVSMPEVTAEEKGLLLNWNELDPLMIKNENPFDSTGVRIIPE